MVPVLTSFLPPYQPDLYIPFLFKLWEAFNSNVIDERLLELAGELSEQHVAGPHGESPTEYQDIGIWSGSQWSIIVNKGLGSMSMLSFRCIRCPTWLIHGQMYLSAQQRYGSASQSSQQLKYV